MTFIEITYLDILLNTYMIFLLEEIKLFRVGRRNFWESEVCLVVEFKGNRGKRVEKDGDWEIVIIKFRLPTDWIPTNPPPPNIPTKYRLYWAVENFRLSFQSVISRIFLQFWASRNLVRMSDWLQLVGKLDGNFRLFLISQWFSRNFTVFL